MQDCDSYISEADVDGSLVEDNSTSLKLEEVADGKMIDQDEDTTLATSRSYSDSHSIGSSSYSYTTGSSNVLSSKRSLNQVVATIDSDQPSLLDIGYDTVISPAPSLDNQSIQSNSISEYSESFVESTVSHLAGLVNGMRLDSTWHGLEVIKLDVIELNL